MKFIRNAALVVAIVALIGNRPALAQDLALQLVSEGCSVSLSTGYQQSIAANTDVSNGYAIEANNSRGSVARSQLVVQRGVTAMTVRLTESSAYYAASSGNPALNNRLAMVLQSPRAARVRLQIDCTWQYVNGHVGPIGQGFFTGAGLSIATPNDPNRFSGQLRHSAEIDLAANVPTRLLFANMLWSQTSSALIDWTVVATPISDYACAPTSYGASCGLDLAIGADFARTGAQFAELRLHGAASPGLLIIGLQRLATPVGPCVLRNDALVVLQVGAARTYFDAPQQPGWSFLLQGAALDGGSLVASSGYQLDCR